VNKVFLEIILADPESRKFSSPAAEKLLTLLTGYVPEENDELST
jgi:hypothetical protein